MINFRINTLQFVCLMMLLTFGMLAFLFVIGQEALDGQHWFQFFADSNTYHQTYLGGYNIYSGNLVNVDGNYLGPLLVLSLLQGNIYLVLILNVYIFTHSILVISRLLNLDSLKVGLLLLISPLTISSLLSVNKEIFVFPFIAFALNGHMRKSFLSMIMALLFSVMIRWQFAGFYLLILLLSSKLHLMRSRTVLIVLILLAISFVYYLIQPWIQPVLDNVSASVEADGGNGSNIYSMMNLLQSQGLYFLVFPFKALQLLFAMGFKVDKIVNPVEIYNDLFIVGHCAVTFVMFFTILKRRLFSMHFDLVFISVIFLAYFCVTPVFAPRYLYFVYVLWVFVVAGAPSSLAKQRKYSH